VEETTGFDDEEYEVIFEFDEMLVFVGAVVVSVIG
jgi:chlorite dismutase